MRLIYRISLLLCLAITPAAHAVNNSNITTWWPDPGGGLMWTGDDFDRHYAGIMGLNYASAVEKCNSLSVDGFTGWRLPTLDEFRPVVTTKTTPGAKHRRTVDDPDLVIGSLIWFTPLDRGVAWLWTSTPAKNGEYASVRFYALFGASSSKPTDHIYHGAVCVRPLEPDIQQIARVANVQRPVSSIDELKTDASLALAQEAYHTSDYSGCISNAKQALQLDSKNGLAYFAMGVCEGALGQFDQATADLATAKKFIGKACDQKVCNVGNAQSWVKKIQKAQEKGTGFNSANTPLPTWTGPQ